MSRLVTSSEIGADSEKRFLPFMEGLRQVLGVYCLGVLALTLSHSAVMDAGPTDSDYSKMATEAPRKISGSPADPKVLVDAANSDRAIILLNKNCPEGGHDIKSDTVIEMGNGPEGKLDQALQAARIYMLTQDDGRQSVVFCGPSVSTSTHSFAGSALIASDPSILQPQNGIRF